VRRYTKRIEVLTAQLGNVTLQLDDTLQLLDDAEQQLGRAVQVDSMYTRVESEPGFSAWN
jgi:hypothetical protein